MPEPVEPQIIRTPGTGKGTFSKQAVVLVHGIGEQVPLATLRGFVETVYQRDLSYTPDQRPRANDPELGVVNQVWVVPDAAAGSAELRRITTPPDDAGRRTDFFEFYWADIMDGTPVDQVVAWIRGLVLRSPFAVPASWRMRLAYILVTLLSLLFVAASIAALDPTGVATIALVAPLRDLLKAHHQWLGWLATGAGVMLFATRFLSLTNLARVKVTLPLVLTVGGVVLAFLPAEVFDISRLWAALVAGAIALALNNVLGPYAGDIVRYVRASPKTVGGRQKVRERGLKLLVDLHANDPKTGGPIYDRIVVVAHSLGTIIAYDLLQMLWEQEGPTHHRKALASDTAKAAFEAADEFVRRSWGFEPESTDQFPVAEFQRKQADVAAAIAGAGLKFRVTDFVTLGAALTHADFLMADDRTALDRNFDDRLMAPSPPRPYWPDPSMIYYDWKAGTGQGDGPFLHFAAPFAAVRWTNIYDLSWNPILGDIVSGPLVPLFGPGIDDQRVAIRKPGRFWPLTRIFTHTRYWSWHDSFAKDVPDYIGTLRRILWPPAPPLPPTPPPS